MLFLHPYCTHVARHVWGETSTSRAPWPRRAISTATPVPSERPISTTRSGGMPWVVRSQVSARSAAAARPRAGCREHERALPRPEQRAHHEVAEHEHPEGEQDEPLDGGHWGPLMGRDCTLSLAHSASDGSSASCGALKRGRATAGLPPSRVTAGDRFRLWKGEAACLTALPV
jgi:hypothetical protein